MTLKRCHKPAILNFVAAILTPEPAVIQLRMTTSKKYMICSKKHTFKSKQAKKKDYVLTNEGEKLKKKN